MHDKKAIFVFNWEKLDYISIFVFPVEGTCIGVPWNDREAVIILLVVDEAVRGGEVWALV